MNSMNCETIPTTKHLYRINCRTEFDHSIGNCQIEANRHRRTGRRNEWMNRRLWPYFPACIEFGLKRRPLEKLIELNDNCMTILLRSDENHTDTHFNHLDICLLKGKCIKYAPHFEKSLSFQRLHKMCNQQILYA